ncbi:MAG: polysaccharide biosynthesis C-terminal domain-containing protein, partial [Clostridia bacterium]|nr:polysaccharide biosynthesis C-terminal domain-containing protein [Clostridia bacterium]
RRLAVVLTRWSAPSLFFLGLAAGLIAALQARRSFILPAFVGVVQNVLLIGALLSAGAIGGVTGVAAATGVAALGQVALLLPGLRPAGYRLHPVPDWREPEVRALPGLLWPVIAVSLAGQFAPVLQRVIGSGLDEGSIAALNYATKLYTFPAGIFALAISTTLYPQLAETAEGAVAGRSRDFLATLQRGLRLIAFLLLPAAAGLAVLREPLVRLLFQRGAFDAAATEATAFALGFFALGAVAPAGCLEFTNRALYALRETRLPLLGSLVNLGVTVGVSLLLLRALGHGALALATSVGTVTALACQLWLLRRRLGRLGGRRLLGAALRMLAATAALAAAVAGWQALVGPRLPDGLRADLAVVAGGVVVGGTVYAVLSVLLGLEELGLILDLVAGVWRRAVPAAVRRRLPPLVRAWIRSARRRSVA